MGSEIANSRLIYSSIPAGRRIGIFGGSFDPVHIAHIELANLAMTRLKLDCLVFIPANQNPLKNESPRASSQDRVVMLSLALKDYEHMYISDIECTDKPGASYTVETLRTLQANSSESGQELFFILGADQIEKLHFWKDYRELFKLATLVVFGRSGISPGEFAKINSNLSAEDIKALSEHYIEFNSQISSTEVKMFLKEGQYDKAKQYLSADVYNFLVKNTIY